MKPDAICIFIGPSISRGSPICSALFFKLIFKNNKFVYLCYRINRHYKGQELRKWDFILNFLTEISIIEGNPQTLPKIRIDDVEAEGCLNVTAIPSVPVSAPHYNMQIRDTCSIYLEKRKCGTAFHVDWHRRMNHERLPRHGLYLATSSMTSRGQIWHILNITSSFSATLFWPTSREIFWSLLAIDFPCKLIAKLASYLHWRIKSKQNLPSCSNRRLAYETSSMHFSSRSWTRMSWQKNVRSVLFLGGRYRHLTGLALVSIGTC
jgi:hypothetical protein